jgi:predicted transcriptional regulator
MWTRENRSLAVDASRTQADANKQRSIPGPDWREMDVGPACRICPRRACAHRVEDPFGTAA